MFKIKTNLKQVQAQVEKELERRVKSLKPEELTVFDLSGVRVDFECTMGSPSVDLNAYVNQILLKATPQVFKELGEQLQANMRAGGWGWTDGTRDIVDTGELMNSQSITVTGFSVSIAYDSPYAAITHYGGYIYPYGNQNATKVYLPARPWITATIEGGGPVPVFDFYGAYLRAIES